MHIKKVFEAKLNSVDKSFADYDHMVYVRLFEGCNLACEHCFIPSNPKKIDLAFYKDNNLTNTLMEQAKIKPQSKLYLQWHGGEPTLLGVNYLRAAIEEIEKDTRFVYQHGIQTNLMNFADDAQAWAQLYHDHFNSQLGISWDAKIRHVKRKEQTEQTNAEFEERFWSNVALAQQHGLQLYLVVTVTKVFFEEFKNPFDFFQMMHQKGIKTLNFERVTNTGSARISWDRLGLTNAQYSQYMSKFFKAYILFKDNHPEVELHISPFDGLLQSVLGQMARTSLATASTNAPPCVATMANTSTAPDSSVAAKASQWDILSYKNQGYGCWSGQCDTRFHTIDSNGYKHGCTALTSEQDNKNKTLHSVLDTKKIVWFAPTAAQQKEKILQTRSERQDSCSSCEFLSICSSGCLAVEKFDSSQECSGAKGLFTTIKNLSMKSLG